MTSISHLKDLDFFVESDFTLFFLHHYIYKKVPFVTPSLQFAMPLLGKDLLKAFDKCVNSYCWPCTYSFRDDPSNDSTILHSCCFCRGSLSHLYYRKQLPLKDSMHVPAIAKVPFEHKAVLTKLNTLWLTVLLVLCLTP